MCEATKMISMAKEKDRHKYRTRSFRFKPETTTLLELVASTQGKTYHEVMSQALSLYARVNNITED